MTRALFAAVGVLLCARSARAELSQERRDYILAHPHGWVEVVLVDRAIPQVPSSDEEHPGPMRPVSCVVRVEIGGETFVHGSAYPTGDAPPYRARIGFRFPVQVGGASVRLAYSGCDLEGGKLATVEAEARIAVEADRVVELKFDGTHLSVQRARAP